MSSNCTILATGVHRYGNGARFTIYNVVNDMLASEAFFGYQLGSGLGAEEVAIFDEAEDGVDFRLTLSPRGEKKDFIMDAEKMAPVEFKTAGSNEEPVVLGEFPAELIGVKFQGASYFKYAGKSMMVTPFENEEGFVAGLKLFDITDGLDKAVEVKLDYGFFEPYGAPTAHASAGAYVNGNDLTLYLYVDGLVWSFTTTGVQQPIVARVSAHSLNVYKDNSDYTFAFVANQPIADASLVFYADGAEVGTVAIAEGVVEGENKVVVAETAIPAGAETWALSLVGASVPGIGLVEELIDSAFTKPYGTVDAHPLSEHFGQYYVINETEKGLYILDADMNKLNDVVYTYTDADATWNVPRRAAVASDGTLFVADYSDPNSGIYLVDPADPTKATQFFAGTRDGNGVFTNNGVNVGASTAGISIYKEGAESKLVVYNEDFGSSLGNILIYNIGQEDGSIVKTWEGAPNEVYGKGSNLAGLVNKNGQPILTDHGFFVSTLRYAGGNNSYATSARYYNFNEECEFSTHYDAFAPYVNGSNDGAMALSNDQKYLVLQDDSSQFVVFECAWDSVGKLDIKYVQSFKHELSVVYQLSFDYAGQLVAMGPSHIFQLPFWG